GASGDLIADPVVDFGGAPQHGDHAHRAGLGAVRAPGVVVAAVDVVLAVAVTHQALVRADVVDRGGRVHPDGAEAQHRALETVGRQLRGGTGEIGAQHLALAVRDTALLGALAEHRVPGLGGGAV